MKINLLQLMKGVIDGTPFASPLRRGLRFIRNRKTRNAARRGNRFARALDHTMRLPVSEQADALNSLFQRSSLSDFYAFYVSSTDGPHYHMPWEGRELTKLPFDFLLYKTIFEEVRPEIVLEIGTQRGWSSVYFASLLSSWNGKVITVDINRPPEEQELENRGIAFIHGNVNHEFVGKEIADRIGPRKCLIIDDGSHSYADVLATLRAQCQHVPVGSYILVEDSLTIRLTNGVRPDAYDAVAQFLTENASFEQDHRFDRFVFFSAFGCVLRRRS